VHDTQVIVQEPHSLGYLREDPFSGSLQIRYLLFRPTVEAILHSCFVNFFIFGN
jgi:hypothetical protein